MIWIVCAAPVQFRVIMRDGHDKNIRYMNFA